MRHRIKDDHLSRNKGARKAVLRSVAIAILSKQRIKTTPRLAKAARRVVEKLITLGKKNTLAARRRANEVLNNRDLVKLLFDEIAPKFADRNGGYTRILKLQERRKGDNAQLCIFELTEYYRVKDVDEIASIEEKPQKGLLGGLGSLLRKKR